MKKGDWVRIGDDLNSTIDRYGPADSMYEMKGRDFPLERVHHKSAVIKYKGSAYTFAVEDLEKISDGDMEQLQTKDPEVFDPQHLVLD